MEYNDKIKSAIRLLQSIPQDGPIEICYSGGKDSDVILELAKMARIPYEAIYKQTSICPPYTSALRRKGMHGCAPKENLSPYYGGNGNALKV